ncbi:MAG: hypothetical protein KGZ59_08250 [Chitinophagaceae bacterium]|nr:hypothetical protein [Chitinophagaceae bacterium]
MLDTNYIIYYKNFIVITEKVENSNDKIYLQSNRVIKHRYSSFEYFVYKTGWDSGYYYKKINDSLPTKISIVEKLKINDFSDYDFYVITNDIKFINEKKINSNELEKEFVSKNLNALGCYDTGYFYFTKDFPDKVYNLSKKFQTNEGLKLTRFRLKPGCLINEIKINNENKSPSFDYWITKDTLQNISEVLTLIDNFSKKNLK